MAVTAKTQTSFFVCSLEEALSYDGAEIVERFLRRFDVSNVEAAELFQDIKRWLWLIGSARMDRLNRSEGIPEQMVIDGPTLILDKMWHNFVCFTKEYAFYCEEKFGGFIHHVPMSSSQRKLLREKMIENPSYQKDRKRIQYRYVYDKLGETILKRWYVEYPERYSAEKILSLRRP